MPTGPRRPRPRPDGSRTPLESVVARLDDAAAGSAPADSVPSGFPSLDRMLGGGFRRRDLVVLGGDVGSGKSALALGMAIRSARAGVPVLYLSGEMSEERVLERALALGGRATVDEIRQGRVDEVRRAAIGAAAVGLRNLPLVIRPLERGEPDEIEAALDIVPRRGLLVVDSLQHVAPPRPTPRQEERVALGARTLKGLALARDAAVVAVAQLPKLRAARPDPRPTLDDFGGLGAVKQQADLVLGVFREEMYRPGGGVEGATELLVLKNRNGPTGFVDLYFYAQWLRFEDMLDPEP